MAMDSAVRLRSAEAVPLALSEAAPSRIVRPSVRAGPTPARRPRDQKSTCAPSLMKRAVNTVVGVSH